LTEDGEVYGCGYNSHGQLGLGHAKHAITPEKMLVDEKIKFLSVNHRTGDIWESYFRYLYIGYKKNSKCIWSRVPIEIIKEICKWI